MDGRDDESVAGLAGVFVGFVYGDGKLILFPLDILFTSYYDVRTSVFKIGSRLFFKTYYRAGSLLALR